MTEGREQEEKEGSRRRVANQVRFTWPCQSRRCRGVYSTVQYSELPCEMSRAVINVESAAINELEHEA